MLNTQIISIEGNIGSGKSTLLDNIKQDNINNDNIIFLQEPVNEWEKIKDEEGNTILKKFYEDQEKYSFSFQMMAYISRLSLLKKAIKNNPNKIIVTERSLYTDKLVFAKMLYEAKKIELVNYKIYLNWFDEFIEDLPINKIIYVKTDFNICYDRIIKRSRNGESTISKKYLEDCNTYHNNMIYKDLKNEVEDILVINGNIDINNNYNELKNWLIDIKKFID